MSANTAAGERIVAANDGWQYPEQVADFEAEVRALPYYVHTDIEDAEAFGYCDDATVTGWRQPEGAGVLCVTVDLSEVEGEYWDVLCDVEAAAQWCDFEMGHTDVLDGFAEFQLLPF